MIWDLLAVVISSLVLLGAIISTAWRLGTRLGTLEAEVRGHNKRLDSLTAECKTLYKDLEKQRTQGRE